MQQHTHGDICVVHLRRKLAAAAAAAAADAGAPAGAAALLHASLGASVRTQYLAGLAGQLASLDRRRARRGCADPDPDPGPDAGSAGRDEGVGEEEEGGLAARAPGRQGRCGGAARSGAAAESDQGRVCDPDPEEAQRSAWLRAAAVLRADGEWARHGADGDPAALEVRTMPQWMASCCFLQPAQPSAFMA